MQIAALAVPPYPGELEDRPEPRHQQLLHRELGTGVQPEWLAAPVRPLMNGMEGAQMDLLAGRRHRIEGFDLRVAACREEAPRRLGQQRPTTQEGQARGKLVRVPGGAYHAVMLLHV